MPDSVLRALRTQVLVLALSLAGCGGLFDGCTDYDGPEFETPGLPSAVVMQPYDAVVSVDIVRHVLDDGYFYAFDVDGDIPPGLQVEQQGVSRHLRFVGTPTTVGTYQFKVSVSVTSPSAQEGDFDSLCWTEEWKTYVIVVEAVPA